MAVLFLLAFLLLSPFFAVTPSFASDLCTAGISLSPPGPYAPGTAITIKLTTCTSTSGFWFVTNSASLLASGFVHCPSGGCSAVVLTSTLNKAPHPLSPGTYYAVEFGIFHLTFEVTSFLVTPQFPLGIVVGVLAPLGAFISSMEPGENCETSQQGQF